MTLADQGLDETTLANIARAQEYKGRPQTDFLVDYKNVADLVARQTAVDPDRTFLIFYNEESGECEEYSYKRFDSMTNQMAAFLQNVLGVSRGDRVGTIMYNHAQTVLCYFATMKVGACVVPVNCEDDLDKIVFTFDNAEVKTVIARHDFMDKAREVIASCAGAETLIQSGGQAAAGVASGSFGTLEDEAAGQPEAFSPKSEPELMDDALIIYTSGTTGNPKGVVLSQYNLMIDPASIARWQKIGPETRMMNILPIHHVNGIVVTLFTPMVARSSVVVNRRFSASKFWKRAADEGVHIVSLVPTILQFLSEANEDISVYDLSKFRHVVCGAGTLAISVAQRFEERFGFPVLHGYGLSETTCYDCFLPPDLSDDEHRKWMRDYGYPSIGCPIDVNEMAIHDPEGNSLGEEERGEIVVRGHLVMKYYYNRPDANAETFKHGWFRTGDEGFFKIGPDGRQYFFITGRLKELIIRGGVNISPFEVEEVMNNIEGVKVGLAIAFDNDWYSEDVGAYVVLDEGAELSEKQIIDACLKTLPFAKCPKVIKFGAEIPVTSTGKYQRLKLKSLFDEYKEVQFKKPK